jgi:hypothetical protein
MAGKMHEGEVDIGTSVYVIESCLRFQQFALRLVSCPLLTLSKHRFNVY